MSVLLLCVTILQKNASWWIGRLYGKTGMFPAECVRILNDEIDKLAREMFLVAFSVSHFTGFEIQKILVSELLCCSFSRFLRGPRNVQNT